MSESLRHQLNHRLVVDFVPLLETNALMVHILYLRLLRCYVDHLFIYYYTELERLAPGSLHAVARFLL